MPTYAINGFWSSAVCALSIDVASSVCPIKNSAVIRVVKRVWWERIMVLAECRKERIV